MNEACLSLRPAARGVSRCFSSAHLTRWLRHTKQFPTSHRCSLLFFSQANVTEDQNPELRVFSAANTLTWCEETTKGHNVFVRERVCKRTVHPSGKIRTGGFCLFADDHLPRFYNNNNHNLLAVRAFVCLLTRLAARYASLVTVSAVFVDRCTTLRANNPTDSGLTVVIGNNPTDSGLTVVIGNNPTDSGLTVVIGS